MGYLLLLVLVLQRCPIMECCRVDDVAPEQTIAGLPAGRVDTNVSYIVSHECLSLASYAG